VRTTESESRKQEEERIRQENVRLEERTRIAQELHDTPLQTFQAALLHLGLLPLRTFRFVAELATSGFAVELPVDFGAVTIHAAVPGSGFVA
jgi:hypothetical protein